MSATMIQLGVDDCCNDAGLRSRISQTAKAPHTRIYVVMEDGLEVAFLALDQIPYVDYLVLYEIFVRTDCRGKGLGSRLLGEVESLAKALGYEKITLSPRPLEQGHSEEELIAWYKIHGYAERPNCPTELEKSIDPSGIRSRP
ncbi:GNAT family N-acetyltransferase [Rhodopseudomonas sp. BR0G17]|uniref:GNAT family N-acetyltransferase n=1 Tax=Rhodopseudomonas sp. BR0G17 TaxID=2269368 RepID=UPI0013DF2C54|nr:GNAT family N-acetyltransferase [Rhodopseudomonas sp. BR0G17]